MQTAVLIPGKYKIFRKLQVLFPSSSRAHSYMPFSSDKSEAVRVEELLEKARSRADRLRSWLEYQMFDSDSVALDTYPYGN